MKKKPGAPQPERLLRAGHALVGIAVAAVPGALVLSAAVRGKWTDLVCAAAVACVTAGALAASTAALMGSVNTEMRAAGRIVRVVDELLRRTYDFLFDNPALAAQSPVRRALMPTDAELADLPLHDSTKEALREMRTRPVSGVRTGESYRVGVESTQVDYYEGVAARALAERSALIAEVHRLRRRLGALERVTRSGGPEESA